jgi:hypothetical protein
MKTVELTNHIPQMSASDTITVGDNRSGINGAICNVAYYSTPLSNMQIVNTYNLLRFFDPPLIPGISSEQRSTDISKGISSSIKDWFTKIYDETFPQFHTMSDPNSMYVSGK